MASASEKIGKSGSASPGWMARSTRGSVVRRGKWLTLPMARAREFSVHHRDYRPGSLKGLPGPDGHCRLGGGVAAQALFIVWHPCPRRVRTFTHGNDLPWNAQIRFT